MQYLLGAGGSASEGGGHAAGVFDELRPMLLSIGPLLEMDSNMQHDDDSQLQRHYWMSESDTSQSKTEQQSNLLSDVWIDPALLHPLKSIVMCYYSI